MKLIHSHEEYAIVIDAMKSKKINLRHSIDYKYKHKPFIIPSH